MRPDCEKPVARAGLGDRLCAGGARLAARAGPADEEVDADRRSETSRPGLTAIHAGAKAVVLLVDDNADMREYVASLLSWRFNVVPAGNGKAGARRSRRSARPDLVLTDVMMPEMDGFALLAALRQNPCHRAPFR